MSSSIYDPHPCIWTVAREGEHLRDVLISAVELATSSGLHVFVSFNNVPIMASPNDDVDALWNYCHREWDVESKGLYAKEFKESDPKRRSVFKRRY
jgi:hypothetical protein